MASNSIFESLPSYQHFLRGKCHSEFLNRCFAFPCFTKCLFGEDLGTSLQHMGFFPLQFFFELISELAEISSPCLSVKEIPPRFHLSCSNNHGMLVNLLLLNPRGLGQLLGIPAGTRVAAQAPLWFFLGTFGAAATTNDSAERQQQAQPAEQDLGWV